MTDAFDPPETADADKIRAGASGGCARVLTCSRFKTMFCSTVTPRPGL